MSLINFSSSKTFCILVLSVGVLAAFSSLAVTNQELMDRLDDIEFDQQMRETNREMNELLMQQIRNSQTNNGAARPKTSNNKDLKDCGIIWRGGSFMNIEKATINDAVSSAYKNKALLRASTRGYVESLYPKLIEADKRNKVQEATFYANEIRANSITFLYPKSITEAELNFVIKSPKINQLCP